MIIVMKKLFIYYSYTGNGEVVKQKMQEKGYDIRKVETLKNLPKSFFFAMMAGGFQAGIKKKAKLKEFDFDIIEACKIALEDLKKEKNERKRNQQSFGGAGKDPSVGL